MYDLGGAGRVFGRQIEGLLVDLGGIDAPALGAVGPGLAERDELGQIGVVERVGFAHAPARIELVVPDLPRRRALLEEEDDRLDAGALERAARAVQDGMQIAALQQLAAQADGGVVGVGQKGIFDDHTGSAAGLQAAHEVLQKERGSFARFDGEVLLHLGTFFAAEGWVGQDDIVAIALLDVHDVFAQRIGVDDVGRFDAVQDEVHDGDNVGQRLFFFSVERGFLEDTLLLSAAVGFLGTQVIDGLTQKARRADGTVVDALADGRLDDLDDGADQWPRRVVLAAVAPSVAHVVNFGFVEVRKLVFLLLRAEAQAIHLIDDVAHVVAALDFVGNLAKNLADFVLECLRGCSALGEAAQIREEALIDEVAQIVAGHGAVVDAAIGGLGCGPDAPAVWLVEDVAIAPVLEGGSDGAVFFEPVEILEEQQPRGLLGIVELRGAAGLFAERVVNIAECLFEHGGPRFNS